MPAQLLRRILLTTTVLFLSLAVWPAKADAQWGRYPRYGYRYAPADSWPAIRLQVTPREAAVFVDGYDAGEVDDFDGMFQRLRLPPGPHEITIYLDGYRTVRRALYLNPDTYQHIRLTLEPLGPGEQSEPPPPPARLDPPQDPRRLAPPPPDPVDPAPAPVPIPRLGVVALTVDPPDAEIYVDGERWAPASGESRWRIRLPEGRHQIEIRKEGFATFSETIGVFRDRTMTLNVTLKRGAD